MSAVRRFAAAGLDGAARRNRRAGGMRVGALDRGQEKQGSATAGVKRQYLGCAGRVANGIKALVPMGECLMAGGHDLLLVGIIGGPFDLRYARAGNVAEGLYSAIGASLPGGVVRYFKTPGCVPHKLSGGNPHPRRRDATRSENIGISVECLPSNVPRRPTIAAVPDPSPSVPPSLQPLTIV